MKRLMLLPALVLLCACPSEKKTAAPAVAQDTTPVDLSAVKTDMPAAAPDTFKRTTIDRHAGRGGGK